MWRKIQILATKPGKLPSDSINPPTKTMKHPRSIAIAGIILGFLACPATHAGEQAKKAPAGKAKASTPAKAPTSPRDQVFAKYDLDHNKNLDVSESETLVRAYERNPEDPMLKPFDTDHDGKMSDPELMKIVYPNGQPQPKPKKGNAKPKGKGKPKK
jgi:hypothetical protein